MPTPAKARRLPASDERLADRRAVEREVKELERLCGELERSLVAADWNGAANALRDQRRVTHAFSNAMEAARRWNDAEFEAAVRARVQRIYDVREDQIARLQTFHDDVAQRLQDISRWKLLARTMRSRTGGPTKTIGLDRRS